MADHGMAEAGARGRVRGDEAVYRPEQGSPRDEKPLGRSGRKGDVVQDSCSHVALLPGGWGISCRKQGYGKGQGSHPWVLPQNLGTPGRVGTPVPIQRSGSRTEEDISTEDRDAPDPVLTEDTGPWPSLCRWGGKAASEPIHPLGRAGAKGGNFTEKRDSLLENLNCELIAC